MAASWVSEPEKTKQSSSYSNYGSSSYGYGSKSSTGGSRGPMSLSGKAAVAGPSMLQAGSKNGSSLGGSGKSTWSGSGLGYDASGAYTSMVQYDGYEMLGGAGMTGYDHN